ncbi:hypothetical protein F7725_026803 [Dissostichus mawsoni]|uniref:BSD domain-containing protein n=1 Tax=Dissostichus mawsoni TaxID=36200 RepID=A0A7J5X9L3_DISMA|nr:hypothetical protein F7725_026803 [Dissostichus mawsoni]
MLFLSLSFTSLYSTNMFKGFGSWLGLENQTYSKTSDDQEALTVEQEEKVVEAQNEVNKQQAADHGEPEANQEDSVHEKGLSDYIFSFASSATKKISESVVETAQTIKKSTFLGDFQKEQEKFVQEKKSKKSVQFHFEMEQMYPMAAVMLEEDQLLNRMRFDLSAQLTALAAQQQQKDGEDRGAGVSPEDVVLTDNARPKTPPVSIKNTQETAHEEEEEMSMSPGVSEFVSDAFDSTGIDQEDLRKEMEQLVLDKKDSPQSLDEETADWEKELQQELQEYEVVSESENRDEQWDQEIEKMLQADES